MESNLYTLITGAFFALNGAVLMVIWGEIRELRRARQGLIDTLNAHSNMLSIHGLQIKKIAEDVELIFQRLNGIRGNHA